MSKNWKLPSLGARARLSAGLAFALSTALFAHPASAAVVTGRFSYREGPPAANRQIHFENRVSGDMFMAPTNADGGFSVDLPPGTYDLRAERGVVLKADIKVGKEDMNVGQVLEPAPLDVRRPFEREGLGQALVTSPAPATANTLGRPEESIKYGHQAVQKVYGPEPAMPAAPAQPASTKDTNPPTAK
ncbi:MAG TPA: carboxypeptidase-like regulatory domain-containing protein [Candidatus Binataceae bacterium]